MGIPSVIQAIGSVVEDFLLPAISGENLALQGLLEKKQGAVVVFWSSVCSHCTRYDGYLNRFQREHPELALAVVASRENESLDQIRNTARERRLIFPILHDARGEVAKQWSAQQTPRSYLVDHERALRYRGAIDNYRYPGDPEYVSFLEPAIQQWLAGVPLIRTESASFGCAIQSVYYKLPKAL